MTRKKKHGIKNSNLTQIVNLWNESDWFWLNMKCGDRFHSIFPICFCCCQIRMHWTYLHWFLSSKLENPGMPDRPVCDDEWFVTYGYILLAAVAGDDGLPSELVNGLPSDVDVVNAEFWLLAEELLLLWWFNDATDDDNCELINGWNCVYFGSILSNRNFDIARAEPKKPNASFGGLDCLVLSLRRTHFTHILFAGQNSK